ncbi:MFS transporter [Noviherbaspirillum sp. 17J57-3]|uniref:MFS transporter n=2 Tax=Noviherbaspirillum galbum TaxID=2709383 RepID=A0A6B3SQM7_9BURK|nr:MFS transporter [Noviherbaspirillum galbum]
MSLGRQLEADTLNGNDSVRGIEGKAYAVLARAVDIRPGETRQLLAGCCGFMCVLCAYYLLRPLRDALGIAGGAGQLPWLFTATFVVMLAITPVFGAIAGRWPPARFVPLAYRFFSLNILAFSALFLLDVAPLLVARVFFVWLSVFNLFVVSVFWSVMADHFSIEQGKRLFGFIAAGGTAGALLGPALAAIASATFGIAALTIASALLLEIAVQGFRVLRRDDGRQDELIGVARHGNVRLDGSLLSGLSALLRDRYLAGIALYLLLHSFVSTVLYVEQGKIVAGAFPDTAGRTQFFAGIDLLVSVLALVTQTLLTGRLMRWLGVAAVLALLPLLGMAACAALAALPSTGMLALAQGVRRATDYALSRPARETLFTVLGRDAKYKAKNVIDTLVYRGGDAASGWLIATAAAAGIGFSAMTALMAPLTLAWVGLARWLARQQSARADGTATDNFPIGGKTDEPGKR